MYIIYLAFRYSTIVKPLRRKITRRHCLLIVLLVWWVSMVTVSPTLFVYQVKFDETINRRQCDEYGWSEENRTRFSYALTIMIYFLPLIILTVWYTRIVHYIWFRKIPGIENLPLYMHMKMKKKYFKRRKLIRMLLVVVITFALCNLPHHVVTILWYSRNELNWTPPRSMIFIAFHAEILLYLNAALNPLVYGFLHGKIRYVIFKRFLSNRSHRILRLLYWVCQIGHSKMRSPWTWYILTSLVANILANQWTQVNVDFYVFDSFYSTTSEVTKLNTKKKNNKYLPLYILVSFLNQNFDNLRGKNPKSKFQSPTEENFWIPLV